MAKCPIENHYLRSLLDGHLLVSQRHVFPNLPHVIRVSTLVAHEVSHQRLEDLHKGFVINIGRRLDGMTFTRKAPELGLSSVKHPALEVGILLLPGRRDAEP